MSAGGSTMHRTLSPEAATVVNDAIAEAGRRNHNQTTPLHVAATLLASPSGFLLRACIKSHPNLDCNNLALSFNDALVSMPTARYTEPPLSISLMVSIERAQAHQLPLPVKVELEELVKSILDDPIVIGVMREAGFSSLAVKEATIEQSLDSSAAQLEHQLKEIVRAEIGRLVANFGAGGTCYPSIENDWNLHPVSITTRVPLPEVFPRLSQNAERFPETIDNENENHCHNLFAGKGKEKTYEFDVDQCFWPLFPETSDEYSDRRSDSKSDEFSGPS